MGECIRIFREMKGMGTLELASLVGLTNGAISQYETGIRQPSPKALKLIAQALDLPWQMLFVMEWASPRG